jgi:hypothetical protein
MHTQAENHPPLLVQGSPIHLHDPTQLISQSNRLYLLSLACKTVLALLGHPLLALAKSTPTQELISSIAPVDLLVSLSRYVAC